MPEPFANKIQTIALSQTDVAPVGVAVSRWVERPRGILGGEVILPGPQGSVVVPVGPGSNEVRAPQL